MTPRQLPPKCGMQCLGQTSVSVQNFNQIRSAISEEVRPLQTDSRRNIHPFHAEDNKTNKINKTSCVLCMIAYYCKTICHKIFLKYFEKMMHNHNGNVTFCTAVYVFNMYWVAQKLDCI